jgi:hypothetical protein
MLHNRQVVFERFLEPGGCFLRNGCGGWDIGSEGINRAALDVKFEMEMSAGASPGIARERDFLTALHLRALSDQGFVQMEIASGIGAPMVNVDVFASVRMIAHPPYNTISCAGNKSALRCRTILPVMWGSPTGNGVNRFRLKAELTR